MRSTRTSGQAVARLAGVALLALVSFLFPATAPTVHAAAPTLDTSHTAQLTGRGHRFGRQHHRPRVRFRPRYRARDHAPRNGYGGGYNRNQGYGQRSQGMYGNRMYGGRMYGGRMYGGYGKGGNRYGGKDYGKGYSDRDDYDNDYDDSNGYGDSYDSSPAYPESAPDKGAVVAGEMSLAVAHSDTLGDYLTGPTGMTLYWFEDDSGGQPTCYGDCAELWPPVLVAESGMLAASEGVTGTLTTVERSDGTYQVTYNGRPLYYYAQDQQPGDTTGHGVDGVWWVATP